MQVSEQVIEKFIKNGVMKYLLPNTDITLLQYISNNNTIIENLHNKINGIIYLNSIVSGSITTLNEFMKLLHTTDAKQLVQKSDIVKVMLYIKNINENITEIYTECTALENTLNDDFIHIIETDKNIELYEQLYDEGTKTLDKFKYPNDIYENIYTCSNLEKYIDELDNYLDTQTNNIIEYNNNTFGLNYLYNSFIEKFNLN